MNKAKHLMIIEFEERFCNVNITKVALFNSTRISEEEVNKLIITGRAEHDFRICIIDKETYEMLCDKTDEEEFYEDLKLEQKEQM